MSISLLEQKKKYKFLWPILGGITLVTLIIIWLGFFKNSSPAHLPGKETPLSAVQRINIDWDTLKNPILETLEPFDVIQPLQGSYGRKNPFLPY